MTEGELARFEAAVLPHLDAAYTLARYLMRSPQDAEDAVQEACLRALTYFGGFRGDDGRAWLLQIVRNDCFSRRHRLREDAFTAEFDDERHSAGAEPDQPDVVLLRDDARDAVHRALGQLPWEFREALVLRELEGLSYKEISRVVGVPIGTVMSRLARARRRLQAVLTAGAGEGI